jgi:DNA mismatch repair protein MutS
VLGYFIEVTATHAERMLSAAAVRDLHSPPDHGESVRFTTVRAVEMETKDPERRQRALEIEKRLFDSLRGRSGSTPAARAAAAALAELDLAAALADLASAENWCRPKWMTAARFVIEGGRHPVVEQALRGQGGAPFIANDCDLGHRDARSGC